MERYQVAVSLYKYITHADITKAINDSHKEKNSLYYDTKEQADAIKMAIDKMNFKIERLRISKSCIKVYLYINAQPVMVFDDIPFKIEKETDSFYYEDIIDGYASKKSDSSFLFAILSPEYTNLPYMQEINKKICHFLGIDLLPGHNWLESYAYTLTGETFEKTPETENKIVIFTSADGNIISVYSKLKNISLEINYIPENEKRLAEQDTLVKQGYKPITE